MTKAVDRALLDFNVLLSASDTGRAAHMRATAILNDWPAGGTTLYTSGQILREYLSVATRPTASNGLGLSQADALANVRAFTARMTVLAENDKVHSRLHGLLDAIDCTGKQVHDANVVATGLAHGIGAVLTLNTADFARFGHLIEVIAL